MGWSDFTEPRVEARPTCGEVQVERSTTTMHDHSTSTATTDTTTDTAHTDN